MYVVLHMYWQHMCCDLRNFNVLNLIKGIEVEFSKLTLFALAYEMDCASRDSVMRAKLGNQAKMLMVSHRWDVLGSTWKDILKLG